MSELRGLDAWLGSLADQELPTLNAVVREICAVSQNELSRADDLTSIILRDANLTSRVLKIANSVHYNASFEPIKTVSRAIVRLGFENLKNITLASSLIENFLQGKPQALLIQSMARAFHAAVQAKAMVSHLKPEQREQVFIAALLQNIAELALLSSAKPAAIDFVLARNKEPEKERSLAQTFLGVDVTQLNQQLVKDWSLGDLIQDASGTRDPSPSLRAIQLGNDISKHIHKGMQDSHVIQICEKISQLCKTPLDETKKNILLKVDESSIIAKNYGADILISALPDPAALKETLTPPIEESTPDTTPDSIEPITTEKSTVSTPDISFQQHMNKLHQSMLAGDDITKTTQASLFALYEGSKIPRCAICFLDYKTKTLDVRYVAGKNTHLWRQQIKIMLDQLRKGELLHDLLLAQKPIWHKSKQHLKDIGRLSVFGASGDIVLAPIHHNKRLVAIVYGDAVATSINEKQFEEFQLIANQLNLLIRLNSGVV